MKKYNALTKTNKIERVQNNNQRDYGFKDEKHFSSYFLIFSIII